MDAVACPSCGGLAKATARFCRSCGATLTPSAIPPAWAERAGEAASAHHDAASRDWRTLRSAVDLFALLLLSSLIAGWITRVEPDVAVDLTVAVVDALVVVVFAARERDRLRMGWAPRWPDRGSLLRVLGAAAATAVVVQGYFAFLRALGAPFVRYTDAYVAAGWPTWAIYLMISAAPALFEELGFRGVIQGTFERLFSRQQALVLQAVLFSTAHLSPVAFPSHFVLGYALGYVRNQTGSLHAGIALHALWNAAVVLAELR